MKGAPRRSGLSSVCCRSKSQKSKPQAHSTKKFGLHQPRPSPDPPTSVTSCSTPATTPRPPAGSVFDDLYGQDSVFGSDGSDGFDGESERFIYGPPFFPRAKTHTKPQAVCKVAL
jgi:hypothetical protein